jgi:hypothetical protein
MKMILHPAPTMAKLMMYCNLSIMLEIILPWLVLIWVWAERVLEI